VNLQELDLDKFRVRREAACITKNLESLFIASVVDEPSKNRKKRG